MKVVIAGSRTITDYAIVDVAMTEAARQGIVPTEVVSGCARGADGLGEAWAGIHGIPIKRFPADWQKHQRGAGLIRNEEMALYGDALVLLWDGRSRGSRNMLEQATARGLRIYVHPVGEMPLRERGPRKAGEAETPHVNFRKEAVEPVRTGTRIVSPWQE